MPQFLCHYCGNFPVVLGAWRATDIFSPILAIREAAIEPPGCAQRRRSLPSERPAALPRFPASCPVPDLFRGGVNPGEGGVQLSMSASGAAGSQTAIGPVQAGVLSPARPRLIQRPSCSSRHSSSRGIIANTSRSARSGANPREAVSARFGSRRHFCDGTGKAGRTLKLERPATRAVRIYATNRRAGLPARQVLR